MNVVVQSPPSASLVFPIKRTIRATVCARVILLSSSKTGVPSSFMPVPENSPIEYKDHADCICSVSAASTGTEQKIVTAAIIEVICLSFFKIYHLHLLFKSLF